MLNDKKLLKVPRKLTSEVMDDLMKQFIIDFEKKVRTDLFYQKKEHQSQMEKLLKKKKKPNEVVQTPKDPTDFTFQNFDIICLFEDNFLCDQIEIQSLQNQSSNFYLYNLSPKFYKINLQENEQREEEEETKQFIELTSDKQQQVIEQFKTIRKTSKPNTVLKNMIIIKDENEYMISEDMDELSEQIGINFLKRIDEYELKMLNYQEWVQKKDKYLLNFNHDVDKIKLMNEFENSLELQKKQSTEICQNVASSLIQAISNLENNQDSLINNQKQELFDDQIKKQELDKVEQLLEKKKQSYYIPLYELNYDEILLNVNLLELQKQFNEQQCLNDKDIINYSVKAEIQRKDFLKKVQRYFSEGNQMHKMKSQYNQNTNFFIFYDKFDINQQIKKKWQKDSCFIPYFGKYDSKNEFPLYDMKKTLINDDEDLYGTPKIEITKLILQNYQISCQKVETQDQQEKIIFIKDEASNIKHQIKNVDKLQQYNLYLEKQEEISQDLVQTLKSVSDQLIEKNKKAKKKQIQLQQAIPEKFLYFDYFNQKHDKAYWNLTLNQFNIKGNFLPSFDYSKFKDQNFTEFSEYLNNKFGYTNKRSFGFSLYFDLNERQSLQVLQDGNVLVFDKESNNNQRIYTQEGNIVEYEQYIKTIKNDFNPLLPDEFELEKEEEEIKKSTNKNSKSKKKKKQEVIEPLTEIKVEKIIPKTETILTNKIRVRSLKGDQYIFEENKWTNISLDGTVVEENFKNEIHEKDKILSCKRSSSPIDEYPFVYIRDDGLLLVHKSPNEKNFIYEDSLQILENQNEFKIQQKDQPVVQIRNTSRLSKCFQQEFLNLYRDKYLKIEFDENIELNILRKKNEDGFLVLFIKDQENFIFIDEKGFIQTVNKQSMINYKNNTEKLMIQKQQLNAYLEIIQDYSEQINRIDQKFNKSKRKKKKDIEKIKVAKLKLQEEYKIKILKKLEQIKNNQNKNNNFEMKSIEEEQQSSQQDLKSQSNVESEENVIKENQQKQEEEKELKKLRTVQFIEDEMQKDKTVEKFINLFQKEKEEKLLRQKQKEKEQNQTSNFLKREELLMSVFDNQTLNDNFYIKTFIDQFITKKQPFQGLVQIDLQNHNLQGSDFLNRKIEFSLLNENNIPGINFCETLKILQRPLENIIQNQENKPNGLTLDLLQDSFQLFASLLFKNRCNMDIFMQINDRFFNLKYEQKLKMQNFVEKFSSQNQNLKIYYKINNKNFGNEYRKKILTDVKLEKPIDLINLVNISSLEKETLEKRYPIEIQEIYFQDQKIQQNSKKNKETIEDNDFYKIEQMYDIYDYITKENEHTDLESEKNNIQTQINQVYEKQQEKQIEAQQTKKLESFEMKLKDQQKDLQLKLKNLNKHSLSFLNVKKQLQKKKRQSIQLISDEKKLILKIKQETEIKAQTCQLVNNYFDSFEGRIFLGNNEIKPYLNDNSNEKQMIIDKLLQKAKQVTLKKKSQTMKSLNYTQVEIENDSSYQNEQKIKKKSLLKSSKQFKINQLSRTRQIKDEIKKFQKEEEEKCALKRLKKTNKYDVYGNPRKDQPFVKSLYKTVNNQKQKNIKHIEVEAEVDLRCKTSAMSRKMYLKADSTHTIRQYAPHKLLMDSIDQAKPQDFLMFKKNLMPISEYNDPSLRDIKIFPDVINYGILRKNSYYKTKLEVLNENALSQRIKISAPKYCDKIFVLMEQGPLACGMKKPIYVEINTQGIPEGKFKYQMKIITKHYEYKIPIIGHIVTSKEETLARQDLENELKRVKQLQISTQQQIIKEQKKSMMLQQKKIRIPSPAQKYYTNKQDLTISNINDGKVLAKIPIPKPNIGYIQEFDENLNLNLYKNRKKKQSIKILKSQTEQLESEIGLKDVQNKRLKKFINKETNMFQQKSIRKPKYKFKVHKLTKIPQIQQKMRKSKNKICTIEEFPKSSELKVSQQNISKTKTITQTGFETSQNLPKMFYDKNFNLTLTKQTHEFTKED